MFYLIYGGTNFKGSGETALRGIGGGADILAGGSSPPIGSGQQKPSPVKVGTLPNDLANTNNITKTSMNQFGGVYPGWELNNGLCMEIMHFDNVDREFVLSADHTTYHYTRWTIALSLYINPEMNGFSLNTTNTNYPSIVESDVTIRNFLKRNRRRLTILCDSSMESTADATNAYQVLLDCPTWGYTIDNEEGPIVHQCSIKSFMGSSGYICQFVVTCATDDSQCGYFDTSGANQNNRKVPLLLSNRWNMKHSYRDGYLTRTITGTAVANVPELKRRNLVIDQVRSMIFPPLYPGMSRSYDAEATAEGSTLTYIISDTQEPMTYMDQVIPLPAQIRSVVDQTNNNSAFEGVYFEGPNDVNTLRSYLKSIFPDSTQSAVPLPYFQGNSNSNFTWFNKSPFFRRDVESLQVVHSMNVVREVSDAELAYAFIEAGKNVSESVASSTLQRQAELNSYERAAENAKRNKTQPPMPPSNGSIFRKQRAFNAVSAGLGSTEKIARLIDAMTPNFIEVVRVIAVCKPEGNMKRAFYMALSTAYGLANNSSTGTADPYTIKVKFDYSRKTIEVQISYSAIDSAQANRRSTMLSKIMVGPQSYLIGGPIDRNVKAQMAFNSGNINALQALLGPNWLQNFPAINSFDNSSIGADIFTGDVNAQLILSNLTANDLPDRNCLIMMDQSAYGQNFPTFGPNGDQISRSFMECFVPLFSAPLVSVGQYPVMLGRSVYPQTAPAGETTSTNLDSFYRRADGFYGDSQQQMAEQVDKIQQLNWKNKPF